MHRRVSSHRALWRQVCLEEREHIRIELLVEGDAVEARRNVGQMYTLFSRAIRGSQNTQPTFETAVDLHRLVDAIKQASDTGGAR